MSASEKVLNMKVLFICTHNRCRSILSEAITRQRHGDSLEVRSAGSQPVGEVHPLSIQYLSQMGYDTEGLCSESWDDFEHWSPDVVVTVCDRAAGEACPVYFGMAIKRHWGLSDPSALQGDAEAVETAFLNTIRCIEGRADALAQIASLPRDEWSAALDALTTDGG
jgi:arsenate reductase